jgi:hypothetical protein
VLNLKAQLAGDTLLLAWHGMVLLHAKTAGNI